MSNPPVSNGLFVGNLKVRILDMDLEEILGLSGSSVCKNIPQKTEERRGRAVGKERADELFCPSSSPYLCGEDTNAVKEARLKGKNTAVCRVAEHDCNFKGTPLGKSEIAKKVYQSSSDKSLSARYYKDRVDPSKITNCNDE